MNKDLKEMWKDCKKLIENSDELKQSSKENLLDKLESAKKSMKTPLEVLQDFKKVFEDYADLSSEFETKIKKLQEEETEIETYLLNPKFFELILDEIGRVVVGEREAIHTIFLTTSMRLVKRLPEGADNLLINSPSGAGKDFVSKSVFEILPDDEKFELRRITPKALVYKEGNWIGKCLRLEDVSSKTLNDESMKVFLSANPSGKNVFSFVNGNEYQEREIIGKPSIIFTTAHAFLYNETLRRIPVLSLDVSEEQTKKILENQIRNSKRGSRKIEYNSKIKKSLSKLEQVFVKIPFADKLKNLGNEENLIIRTTFERLLSYIKASAAIHQFQRTKDSKGSIEATPEDYEIARVAFNKTITNSKNIPLTHHQTTILKIFKDKNLHRQSIQELSDLKEIQSLNITERSLYSNLDTLTSKGFLKREHIQQKDNNDKPTGRAIRSYSYVNIETFHLPEFKELEKLSLKDQNSSNSSNSSNTSNTSNTFH